MITEDYVSYEIAKLLKEKEFDELCFALYNPEEELIQCGVKLSNTQVGRVLGSYSAPTHQMALKWLREVHKLYIYIKSLEDGNCFSVHLLYNGIDKLIEGGAWGSYESCVEAALLYVLKNLI